MQKLWKLLINKNINKNINKTKLSKITGNSKSTIAI